jgi:signal transduction histidine kinase
MTRHFVVQFLLWVFSLLAGNSLFAQEFKKHAGEILQSDWSPQSKIDSLYQLSYQYYRQDHTFFQQVSDSIMFLSEKVNYNVGKAKGHIILSLLAEGQGDLEAMKQHAQKAAEYIPAKPASNELAMVLFFEGNYYRRKKRDKEAMETYFKGLRVAEEAGSRRMEATFNTSLGIMHVGREEYDKALEYYNKALVIAQAANDKNRIQRTYTNKGIVYMRQRKYNEAIQSHQQALIMAKELNDERDEAFVYNDLGATYLQMNQNLPQAIDYLKKSIEIRERLNEKVEIAYTYNYLGEVYGKMNNKKEAIYWIEKALNISIAIGNNKQHYEALESLSNQYSYFGQYDSAYRYLREYTIFRDSVRKTQQADAIAELTVQYETEKKEQEIALLTQQNKIQQLGINQRNLYLFIAALLVAGTLVILWQFYRTRKAKEEKLKQEAAMQTELLQLEARNTLQNDRLRISKDLHDNIGANLTFIQTSIDESAPENAEWQDVKNLVNDTITELRRTVWLINKPSVRLDEWLVKLREYYRKIKKVEVDTDIEDETLVLSSKQATLIFRIIQEAVNNSLKHSGAGNIRISIKADNANMKINILDDGRGFDNIAAYQGFGLENMRQNTEELKGVFSIKSSFDHGTGITIQLPINTQ